MPSMHLSIHMGLDVGMLVALFGASELSVVIQENESALTCCCGSKDSQSVSQSVRRSVGRFNMTDSPDHTSSLLHQLLSNISSILDITCFNGHTRMTEGDIESPQDYWISIGPRNVDLSTISAHIFCLLPHSAPISGDPLRRIFLVRNFPVSGIQSRGAADLHSTFA